MLKEKKTNKTFKVVSYEHENVFLNVFVINHY